MSEVDVKGARGEELGDEHKPYFAIVIGTGFGGAVTACRLAQSCSMAGDGVERSVCVLERGRRYDRHDFPRVKLPDYLSAHPTSKRVPDVARLLWSNDQGLWDLRNLGELRVAQGAGYGGGSLLYANVHLRAPDSAFAGWCSVCADAQTCACAALKPPQYTRVELDPYYARAAEMLEVTPLPVAQRTKYEKTKAMADIAAGFGAPNSPQFIYPPLAISFDAHPNNVNRFGREQHPCTGCGNCTIGCQEGAKNTLDLNYLALAEDLGVHMRTRCEVQTLSEVEDGGTRKIRIVYADYLASETKTIWANNVFLCAGALSSTEILLRSVKEKPLAPGLERRGRPITSGQKLGERFYANGDNIAVAFDTERQINPERGPTITTTFVHTSPPSAGASAAPQPWFLLQDGGIPPSLKEGLGLLKSPLWMGRNRFLPAAQQHAVILGSVLTVLKEARPYWVSTKAAAVLGDALRRMVPDSLGGLADDLKSLDETLFNETGAILEDILKRIDARLRKHFLGSLIVLGREKLAGYGRVDLPSTIEALVARFPALGDLLKNKSTIGYALGTARLLALGSPVSEKTMLFLCMGPDQSGRLHINSDDRLRIAWGSGEGNRPLYTRQERLMRDAATTLRGELRTNPDWTIGQKPITVHAQGGCSMGATSNDGVTTPCGRYWQSDAIYVFDGAALPNSVGVNPSATIAAVAERNVELFIRRKLPKAAHGYLSVSSPNARGQNQPPVVPANLKDALPAVLPPGNPNVPSSKPLGVVWTETMQGYVGEVSKLDASHIGSLFGGTHLEERTALDRQYAASVKRWATTNGSPVKATFKLTIDDVDEMMRQLRPEMKVDGQVDVTLGGNVTTYEVTGTLYIELKHPAGNPYTRDWLGHRVLTGMTYKVEGKGFKLDGRKFVRDDPGFDAWADLSTLYTEIVLGGVPGEVSYFGVIQVSPTDFISKQLRGMDVSGGTPAAPIDDVRKGWTLVRFAQFFIGSAKNAYSDWF